MRCDTAQRTWSKHDLWPTIPTSAICVLCINSLNKIFKIFCSLFKSAYSVFWAVRNMKLSILVQGKIWKNAAKLRQEKFFQRSFLFIFKVFLHLNWTLLKSLNGTMQNVQLISITTVNHDTPSVYFIWTLFMIITNKMYYSYIFLYFIWEWTEMTSE